MNGVAYIMVVVGILLAKGLGFYRDMVFASVFGTGVLADIYFQVFGLVNLIFTGIGVALSTLVIKNLNKSENQGNEVKYASHFLKKSTLWLFIASLVIVVFAKKIVGLILPNITGYEFDIALKMMYIMAPSLVFVVIAYIISGLLQNKRVYFITSIMSLPFNVAIIGALLFKEVSILTVAFVTTVGWFLHIVIQLPFFYKKGYRFFAKSEAEIKKYKNPEILWIFLSNMMFQLCIYVDRAFVSHDTGMASTFNYASNLFITISSVFVVAMSTVVFPSISKNYEEGNKDYVNEMVQYIVTIMCAIFIPYLLVVGLFGEDVIRLVYERGAFTSNDTVFVQIIFFLYSLGVLGYTAQELFNKIFYLAGKYSYTVAGTVAVVFGNFIANFLIKLFVPDVTVLNMSLTSILTAMVTAIFMMGYAVFVAFKMKKIIGKYITHSLMKNIGKILISAFFAFVVYALFDLTVPSFTHGKITFVLPLAFCALVYLMALYVTGVLKQLLKREKKGGVN